MPTATGWRVVSFSAEHASGTIENTSTGERAAFPLEAWSPCEPDAARILRDSVQHRHLLLPQPRETVEVAWRLSRSGKTVPARVVRVESVARTAPPLPFLVWFSRIQRNVPELADWGDGEWARLFHEFDGLEDDVRSTAPASALRHWATGACSWICLQTS